MHELSIISNVYRIVEETAASGGLKKITKINLMVGALNQVVPEMLLFAYETITRGTFAEGSELVIIPVPIRMKCNICKNVFSLTENLFICTSCGSPDLELLEGKELFIKSIEGEK